MTPVLITILPITDGELDTSKSLPQLTTWAMIYHKQEDLEKGIAIVRKRQEHSIRGGLKLVSQIVAAFD